MGEMRRTTPAIGLILLAAGCTADGTRDGKRDDPLYGSGARPVSTSGSYVASTQAPAPPAYRAQPPLTPAVPTSTAAIAGGGFQPLQNGGGDLRIGSGNPSPQQPAQPVAGVTPVPPPGSPAPPPPASTPIGVPAAGGSLDQAYAAVAARNPIWTKMTFNSQAGEYTFQMSLPSKMNSAASQIIEASASTQAEAIRRTLEQVQN
jgi:hypothetical protein